MEDWLEKHRFSARFNAGESGHTAQSLKNLLEGLQPDFEFDLRESLWEIMLNDAPNMGLEELREEVAELHPGATAEQVLITTGTSEAIFLLLRQLAPKKVALVVPAFQLLIEVPRLIGASIIPLALEWSAGGEPKAPIESWCEVLRQQQPNVLILNNPHNPSGLTFKKEEMNYLLATAEELGCLIIGDEHYRFLADSGSLLGPTSYAPGRFVTGSFIKCTGTPGLRIGWCVGDGRLMRSLQSEKNYLTHTVNPISQQLALWFLQSLKRRQTFFRPLHQAWVDHRSYLSAWFNTQSFWTGVSPAGGLVTCVFPTQAIPSDDLLERLQLHGLFMLPLTTFVDSSFVGDERFFRGFRLGLGLQTKKFKELLSVMGSF